jgi:hypothetical protein
VKEVPQKLYDAAKVMGYTYRTGEWLGSGSPKWIHEGRYVDDPDVDTLFRFIQSRDPEAKFEYVNATNQFVVSFQGIPDYYVFWDSSALETLCNAVAMGFGE